MTRTGKLFASLGLAAATLAVAACDGGSDSSAPPVVIQPPPPPPASARFEDQFGINFGSAFRQASLTTDPIDPMLGDIVALSLTTDPVNIP